MHSIDGNPFEVFDPSNIISLPLDRKHYLTIMANTVENSRNSVLRFEVDKWFTLVINNQVEENCEEWIIGYPQSIQNHINDQFKYGQYTETNVQDYNTMKERTIDLNTLTDDIDKFGSPYHIEVIKIIDNLISKQIHKENNVYMNFYSKLYNLEI